MNQENIQTNMVLITHRHVVQMGSTTLHGPVSHSDLLQTKENFSFRFRVEDGVVLSESEADDIGECTVCKKTGLLMECSTATHCGRWYHLTCTPLTAVPDGDWVRDKCITSTPRHTLPPELLDNLRDMQDDGTPIYTSSDGSYRERGNSSTYGVNIGALAPDLNYSFGGHLHITAIEASSFRMELEGLIASYETIPPDIHPLHFMDNTEAIAVHTNLCRYGLPVTRKLMRKAYRRTITLLWHRMQERGAHLAI